MRGRVFWGGQAEVAAQCKPDPCRLPQTQNAGTNSSSSTITTSIDTTFSIYVPACSIVLVEVLQVRRRPDRATRAARPQAAPLPLPWVPRTLPCASTTLAPQYQGIISLPFTAKATLTFVGGASLSVPITGVSDWRIAAPARPCQGNPPIAAAGVQRRLQR